MPTRVIPTLTRVMSTRSLNGTNVIALLDPEHDPGNAQFHNATKMGEKMKAVHYEGPFKVSVREVETPSIQHPDDAIVKVTTAGMYFGICNGDWTVC